MIGRLKGELIEKKDSFVLLDVNGVGYEIEMPLTDLCSLTQTGSAVVIYTHFVVREDAQLLYGFLSETSKKLFRLLIKINGVGPKMALAILAGLELNELVACFKNNDVARLVRIPGVGKKTAERLIVEMQDRLADFDIARNDSSPVVGSTQHPDYVLEEAEKALVALGYHSREAAEAVKLAAEEESALEAIIRKALKGMVKG
ncbi:MAG: Holliday junction branch migration protein RuvA [Gammaproteobacteria bacterium]|nr:MAG: Holliday junction branch migration protein RuvA [Gammaproteobacteria bacterium]